MTPYNEAAIPARRNRGPLTLLPTIPEILEGEIVEEDAPRVNSTARREEIPNDPVCSWSANEVVLHYIPHNTPVRIVHGRAQVLVLGNVFDGAEISARGGHATIHVMGDVGNNVTITAKGNGARITVEGRVSPSAKIEAIGKNTEVKLRSQASYNPKRTT